MLQAIAGYGFEYAYFTSVCLVMSFYILVTKGFDVIHTHNPPDTLFSVALVHKVLFGKKFVYDHHDLSPDLFLEKYSNNGRGIYSILLILEKISCRIADAVIATNESYKEVEIKRCGIDANKIFIVRNGPDLEKMKYVKPIKEIRDLNKTVLCYLGSINNQDGVQYLLDVLHHLVYDFKFKGVLLMVVGDGDYLNEIKIKANELTLRKYVLFIGYVKNRELLNCYLSSADIFVDAAPGSFLNHSSTFIKNMEYMVFKKPIVSFALKESMVSLKDAGIFVQPNDTEHMASEILKLVDNQEKCISLGENASRRVREVSWDIVSKPLLKAYHYIENLR